MALHATVDGRRFNPRSPCGERRTTRADASLLTTFQPTLPLRGATGPRSDPPFPQVVSTHAPLAGSDRAASSRGRPRSGFNPRSPCGERHDVQAWVDELAGFQPTLPLRGATPRASTHPCGQVPFQPTLPLRGATEHGEQFVLATEFQPTLPLRGATLGELRHEKTNVVSTHAPLAGSDDGAPIGERRILRFNPRSPCGERRGIAAASRLRLCFNPRSPCGERLLPFRRLG